MPTSTPIDSWRRVADAQDGVISRPQLLEAGLMDHDIKRLLRRRELTRIQRGVFVTHTGPPSWDQQAWAAVLACWPAVLGGRSALPHPPPGPITVIVPGQRTAVAPRGVRVVRRDAFTHEVGRGAYPPRQRPAYAAIDAVEGLSDADLYALLADLVQTGVVTPRQLRAALGTRRRVGRRRLLSDVVKDLETGALSVLERAYLRRIERAHGLPQGMRQAPDHANAVRLRRDVLYERYGLVVELDGRAFHDNARARDPDARRDLAAAAERDLRSIRLTTGLVLGKPCETARAVATLLQRGGWSGSSSPCPECVGPKVSSIP